MKVRPADSSDTTFKKVEERMSGSDQEFDSRTLRRFSRYPLDIHLSVRVFRGAESVSFWGRSSEMGEDGIGATLTGELETGEVVTMELSLPRNSFPIKFRALVRYRDGLRHGFEFLALSAVQREEIRRMCEILAAGLSSPQSSASGREKI